jgi:hypothetical protein
LLHEGKPVDGQYFDVEQLEPVDEPAVTLVRKPTGGDRPNPAGRSAPTR